MQMNRLVIQRLVRGKWKKSDCTWEKRNFTEGDNVNTELFLVMVFTGATSMKKNKKQKLNDDLAACICSTVNWTIWEIKKWTDYKVDTGKKKQSKHVPEHQQKDGTHQWESGTTGAPSPRWVSGFYNWRLPHQECCSTEGSRHLYTPVGICIIASHLELVAINWITPIIGP